MGKGIASEYSQKEISICKSCFHSEVCGNRDYLSENKCCNFVAESPTVDAVEVVRCGNCRYARKAILTSGKKSLVCSRFSRIKIEVEPEGFCQQGTV